MAEVSVPDMFLSFIDRLSGEDCSRLSLACSAYMREECDLDCHRPENSKQWFRAHVSGPGRPLQRFGTLVALISLLDFELSPFAISRVKHRQEDLAKIAQGGLAAMAKRTLLEDIPRLLEIARAWQALRRHELDEAALWIYRDNMQAQQMRETRRTL